jgi:hypothetical protein
MAQRLLTRQEFREVFDEELLGGTGVIAASEAAYAFLEAEGKYIESNLF